MDLNMFNVDKKNTAEVLMQQTFWIGEDANVEVVVNLYESNGEWKMTSWLNGNEELNTIDFDYSESTTNEEILSAMEKLVNDNEEYILDLASWDGN